MPCCVKKVKLKDWEEWVEQYKGDLAVPNTLTQPHCSNAVI